MPTSSYIFPASGQGFARDACLTTLSSSGSGLPFLGTGTYEQGGIYISDGGSILPISGSTPFPTFFGSWVYSTLGGQLPSQQTAGGLDMVGGGYGGAAWVPIAYTGSQGMQLQTNFGGVLAYDSALPTLSYTVTGNEAFSVQYQVLDNLPQQIEIQFYESSLGWHKVWRGDADHFGLGGTNKGPIAPFTNQWVSFTFSPADMGLTPGMVITGMAWGVWKSGGTSSVVFSDATDLNNIAPIVPILGGFIDATPNGTSGFYILAHKGPLVNVPSVGGTPIQVTLPTSPSFDYTGMTYNTPHTAPYFIGSNGTIYNYSGGLVNTITSAPSGVVAPARQLFTDGSNLYTSFPASNKIGKYSIAGNTWTLTTSPFDSFLDTIYYSSSLSKVVAAGRNKVNLSDGSTIRGMTYAFNPNQLLVTDSSNATKIYDFQNGNWSFNSSVAGTGTPSAIAAEPDGLQALVLDTPNNVMQVLTNTAGTWSATSTVGVSGPSQLAVYTSGITQALVTQPVAGQVSVFNKSVLAWGPGQIPMLVPGASGIAIHKEGKLTKGMVTTSTGVTFIAFNGAVWTPTSALNLSPVPTMAVVDSVNTKNPYFYAAGVSGGVTTVYVFQNQLQVGSYTFTGTIGALSVVNYQIAAPTISGALNVGYYVGGVTSNVVNTDANMANAKATLWVPEITDFYPLLLIAGPNNIWSFYNSKPQEFTRTTDSLIGILTGASWGTVDLNDKNLVSSITTDASGNIFTVNVANAIYKIQSQTTIASGYPFTILPPPNQEEDIPLGLSKLLMFGTKLVSSSSLMGGLVLIDNL